MTEGTFPSAGGPDPETPVGHQSAQPERSGADVVEAVETASAGTPHGGVQTAPQDMKPHAAPVEQVRGDKAMTEGQVVDGPGQRGATPDNAITDNPIPDNPGPTDVGGAGAQSVLGARISDRVSAGEQPPRDPSASGEDV